MRGHFLVGMAVASACSLLAANAANPRPVVTVERVDFTNTPAPQSLAESQIAYTRSSAILTLDNGRKLTVPLNYNVLYSSGDQIGGWHGGAVVDYTGNVLQSAVVDEKGTIAEGPFYAKSPDANSLMKQGNAIYLVTHFEYDTEAPNANDPSKQVNLYGLLPMTMNLATISQNPRTGELVATDLQNIPMNAVNGLWIPCAGELTPWNTHIGGEEYEPDAFTYQNRPLTAMNLFLGTPGKSAAEGGATPYNYGLATEVTVGEDGSTSVTKHYALGRLANELAHVMPDRRTVYKGDDGRDVILAMFVADRAGDLSAGTLYAAKLEQLSGENGGTFNVRWIRLGHATDAEIKQYVDDGIEFSDMIEIVSKADYQADPSAYPGFRPVYTYTGTDGATRLEYIRIKTGMEQAAAFLETRRYAAYLGATTEFTKMEGETSNAADRKLYIAMSYVERGMLAGQNGDRPQDDISLTGNATDLGCGIVYDLNTRGGQADTTGAAIDSDWVAVDMQAAVSGARKPAGQTYGKYDVCDTDKMANPDNIKYSESMRTLFIGEDSGNHLNNFLWAYNVDNGSLVRLASNRAGGEWTGLQAVDELNGFSYIMSNSQHPGAADDLSKYRPLFQADGIDFDAFRAGIDQRGAVGYLGGFPTNFVVRHGGGAKAHDIHAPVTTLDLTLR